MKQVPHWPLRILRWFCKPYYVDAIEGDIIELYQRSVQSKHWKAFLMIFQVFSFIRPRYTKSIDDFKPESSYGMLKNYLKVTLRSMRSNRLQTILNILGLTCGIIGAILIWVHISFQLKVDQHIPNKDRIYRVTLNGRGPYTPARLVKQMKADFPEVENGARISGMSSSHVKIGNQYIYIENGILADSTFFDVFETTFLQGTPDQALNRPNTIVLTESTALKLYDQTDVVGSVIESDGEKYEITAVVVDPPKTSTIPYGHLVAVPHAYWATTGWWTGNNFFSYIKLKENASLASLDAKMPDFVERYIAPDILKFSDRYDSFEEYLADGNQHTFKLIPLTDIHLHHPRLTLARPGSFDNMVIFGIIAIFLVVIACINYINITTAKATLRAKEIGIRKVMGSRKSMIRNQFFMEAYFNAFIALILGFIISILLLPYFNALTDLNYSISNILNPQNLLFGLIILIALGFLSGGYPAFFLSSLKPVNAIKGEKFVGGSSRIRKGLVVFQFAISIFLVSATILVYLQLDYMKNRDLGLDAEQVYIIKNTTRVGDSQKAFVNELKSNPLIDEVGFSNSYPSSFMADWNYKTKGDDQIQLSPYNIFVTEKIKDVWGLELVKGRFFDDQIRTDTARVVVNEEFVRKSGITDPLNVVLTRGSGQDFKIIGVVKDFKTSTAKRDNHPVLFRYAPAEGGLRNLSSYGYCAVRIKSNVKEAIKHIDNTYAKFTADYPLEGVFMDESFNMLYKEEERFGNLFTGFSLLAIIIACIGLFALSSFTLERKTKEIAIRKVLGASSGKVTGIIVKDFLLLILFSALISVPSVFYIGNSWLENYVERIEIGFIVLVLPSILIITFTIVATGLQSFRAAESNPVLALKNE